MSLAWVYGSCDSSGLSPARSKMRGSAESSARAMTGEWASLREAPKCQTHRESVDDEANDFC